MQISRKGKAQTLCLLHDLTILDTSSSDLQITQNFIDKIIYVKNQT